jgi:hypothetical protein
MKLHHTVSKATLYTRHAVWLNGSGARRLTADSQAGAEVLVWEAGHKLSL